MNTRIKLLAEQAGGYVSLSDEHDGKLILSGEDIVENFAKLIVRECIELSDKALQDGKWPGDVLKEHFG